MARSLGAITELTSQDLTTAKGLSISMWTNTTGVDVWVCAQIYASSLNAAAATLRAIGIEYDGTGVVGETYQVTTPKQIDGALAAGMTTPPILVRDTNTLRVLLASTNASDTAATINGITVDVSVASDVQKVGGETPLTQSDVQGGYKYTS